MLLLLLLVNEQDHWMRLRMLSHVEKCVTIAEVKIVQLLLLVRIVVAEVAVVHEMILACRNMWAENYRVF